MLRGFLSIFAAAGVGYIISEGLMRATKRKPVLYLRYVAGAAALLAFFAGNVLLHYWYGDAPFMTALSHFWAERLVPTSYAVGAARLGMEDSRPLDDPRRCALGLHRRVAHGPLASHSGGARLQYPAVRRRCVRRQAPGKESEARAWAKLAVAAWWRKR